MKSEKILVYALLSMCLLLLGGMIPLLILGLTDWAIALLIGFVISFVYIVLAYVTIRHAFGKSAKIFYRFMFGGMAFRFIFFLLSFLVVYRYTSIPLVGFVVSFIVFYIIFQVVEARLVILEINAQRNK